MAKGESLKKDNGIVFGRWRLIPLDSNNWELCEYRDGKTKDGGRATRWIRCGRYYQHSTIGGAFRYAADCEMKRGNAEAAADVLSALAEYERITQELLDGVREAFSGNDET